MSGTIRAGRPAHQLMMHKPRDAGPPAVTVPVRAYFVRSCGAAAVCRAATKRLRAMSG